MLSTDSGDGVIVARIGTTVSEIPNLDVKGVLPEIVLKDEQRYYVLTKTNLIVRKPGKFTLHSF